MLFLEEFFEKVDFWRKKISKQQTRKKNYLEGKESTNSTTRPQGYKTFHATTDDILTFISMINTTSKNHKANNFFTFGYFSFYEQLKFRAQLSSSWKKFYNLVVW